MTSHKKKVARSVGIWQPERSLVLVTRPKGKQWQVFGFMEKGALYLYPEEALYLMEAGDLEVETELGDVTKQEMYGLVMENRVSLEAYQVFADLNRAGFAVWSRFVDVHCTNTVASSTSCGETQRPVEQIDCAPKDTVAVSGTTSQPCVLTELVSHTHSTADVDIEGFSHPKQTPAVKQEVMESHYVTETQIVKQEAQTSYSVTEHPAVEQEIEHTCDIMEMSTVKQEPELPCRITENPAVKQEIEHTHDVTETPAIGEGATVPCTQTPALLQDSEPVVRTTGTSAVEPLTPLQASRQPSLMIHSRNADSVRIEDAVLEKGKLFFEVYSRSKKFKKTDPGTPLCYIAIINADEDFPTCEKVKNYQESLPVKAPLNFALADEGTVTMFSASLGLIPNLSSSPSLTH